VVGFRGNTHELAKKQRIEIGKTWSLTVTTGNTCAKDRALVWQSVAGLCRAGSEVMLRAVDYPPVWLLAAIVIAWLQAAYLPLGLSLESAVTDLIAGLLIGAGIVLAALAIWEMRAQKTTVIPHREADRLVTSGIFKRSRNPIYLADVLILAGFVLRFDAVLSLVLVPLLLRLLEKRFVIPEEDRLRRKFRADFARYCQSTRRWI
jgi:protein-S-isoprenylcysteine O-methyltransferase Ste14